MNENPISGIKPTAVSADGADPALTLEDLNTAIARAMGWSTHVNSRWGWYVNPAADREYPYGNWKPLPDFAHSIDALSAGPERILRERGAWQITARWMLTIDLKHVFEAQVWTGGTGVFTERGATEAEARARAALGALLALEEQRG